MLVVNGRFPSPQRSVPGMGVSHEQRLAPSFARVGVTQSARVDMLSAAGVEAHRDQPVGRARDDDAPTAPRKSMH